MITAFAAKEPKASLMRFEYDPGELASDQVEIDVNFCGVSRRDIDMIDNSNERSHYPLVPGHEIIGRIAKVGHSASRFYVDQIVGLGWQAGCCHQCDACLCGQHHLCLSVQPTIINHHGGFAERVRGQESSVIALPSALDLESACPFMSAGISVFYPLVEFGIKPIDKVAVIGFGGLGHLAVQFLHAWGCEVNVFTSDMRKKSDAIAMGADAVFNSIKPSNIALLTNQFDFILSTVNVQLDWNSYLKALKPGGRLHFLANNVDAIDINVSALVQGQKTLSGSSDGSPVLIGKMLRFAQLHDIKPVIEKYSFDNINQAICRLRNGQVRYRLVLCR